MANVNYDNFIFSRDYDGDCAENVSDIEKTIQEKQEEFLKEMAIEILKKSEIRGSTDKIARELVRIYNMLKTQLISPKMSQIPEQTVFEDYIICLEDGLKMKMLKRHLRVKYNMSFQDYKQKWKLPIDYPSFCKQYSSCRANIARRRRRMRRNLIKKAA